MIRERRRCNSNSLCAVCHFDERPVSLYELLLPFFSPRRGGLARQKKKFIFKKDE